jgi:LCP family protein required for cell wall assembly
MSGDGEHRPPRVAWGLYQRYAIAGALIVLLTTTAVATGALLKVKQVSDTLRTYGHVATLKKDTITKADAGDPQTLLLVGSDRRFGWKRGESRSDTMMLLRLDPDQEATAVMSVPRDLVVDIPGYGREKINAAYSYGGLDLTTRTIKQLLGIKINHAIEVNFRGFREAVNFVGCVYTDVDRRYYHSNVGLPPSAQYAEIDLQPGYQRLCGQKALDYVRFRHADTDLVRAARQQDFVRQAKDQVGTSRLIDDLDPLIKIFAKATETDADLQSNTGILRLLKLAVFSTGHPLREIEFPHTFVNSPTGPKGQLAPGSLGSYVTATPYEISQAVDDFMHARASSKPKSTGKRKKLSRTAKRQKRKNAKKAPTSWSEYGLVEARRRGEDLVAPTVAKGRPRFPLYFPAALTPTGTYPQATTTPPAPMPRVYDLRDRAGKRHDAYRIVVVHNALEGQYYGIQGTTWKNPPFLKHGDETRRMRGRTYHLVYDGRRLRAVWWRTPRATYWVSNTLSLALTNKQMLGTARSLTRFGQ